MIHVPWTKGSNMLHLSNKVLGDLWAKICKAIFYWFKVLNKNYK